MQIAFLVLLAGSGFAWGQTVLKLDFNDRSGNPTADTFPGFTSFLINSNLSDATAQTNPTVRIYGPITVSLSGTGLNPGYNDRQRAEPTNNGAFTESLLLRDFIVANTQVDNGGLNVAISGLASNQLYAVTIWSFDIVGIGRRVSDWFANGQLMVDNYTFDGRVLPVSNESYRFTFYARSDAVGQLLIAGRRDSTSVGSGGTPDFGVYLNALQLEAIFRISSVELRDGKLMLKVDSPQSARVHYLEQALTPRSGNWAEVPSAQFSAPTNHTLTITVSPPLPNPRFYRVRY